LMRRKSQEIRIAISNSTHGDPLHPGEEVLRGGCFARGFFIPLKGECGEIRSSIRREG
jgi:hypothetical protein